MDLNEAIEKLTNKNWETGNIITANQLNAIEDAIVGIYNNYVIASSTAIGAYPDEDSGLIPSREGLPTSESSDSEEQTQTATKTIRDKYFLNSNGEWVEINDENDKVLISRYDSEDSEKPAFGYLPFVSDDDIEITGKLSQLTLPVTNSTPTLDYKTGDIEFKGELSAESLKGDGSQIENIDWNHVNPDTLPEILLQLPTPAATDVGKFLRVTTDGDGNPVWGMVTIESAEGRNFE